MDGVYYTLEASAPSVCVLLHFGAEISYENLITNCGHAFMYSSGLFRLARWWTSMD